MRKVIYHIILFLILCLITFGPSHVLAKEAVASINGKTYDDLQLAFNEVKTGEVITLLQDVDMTNIDNVCTVNLPDKVVFDLGGHNINIKWISSASIGNLIFEGSDITIRNGSFSGKLSYSLWIGDTVDSNHIVLENIRTDGGINVYHAHNVILKNVEAIGHDYYAVWVDNDASVVIESGKYKTNGKNGLVGIADSNSGSSLKILGGSFTTNDQKFLPNSIKPSISGGTFNMNVEPYLVSGYQCLEKNGLYEVSRVVKLSKIEALEINPTQKVKESTLGISNLRLVEKVLLEVLANTQEVNIENKNVKVVVDTKKISPSASLVRDIQQFLKNKAENIKITDYFDISINVIDVDTDSVLGQLTNLGQPLTFVIALPSELQEVAKGYKRTFYVVRNHANQYEIIDTVIADDFNTLTFEADQFSTYALAYYDEEIVENPNTYDQGYKYFITGGISLFLLIIVSLWIKKRKVFE